MKQDFLKGIAAGIVITGALGGAFFWGYHLNSNDIESSSEIASKPVTEQKETEVNEITKEDNIEEDLFNISFGPDHSTLQLRTKDGNINIFHDIVLGDMPLFDYSPSMEKVLLTPSNDFEEGSYLYIYTPDNGLEEIINTEDGREYTSTPNGAVWLDERYVLLTESSRYGTVITGSLAVYDTELKEIKPLNLFKGDAVTNISIASWADHPIVVLSGIKFTDNIQNENEPHVEFYKIDDVLKMIQSM